MIIVPSLFGKPINVWLGIALLFLLAWQIYSGKKMMAGKPNFLPYHRFNAWLIVAIVAIHAFYGLGLWFFNFSIK